MMNHTTCPRKGNGCVTLDLILRQKYIKYPYLDTYVSHIYTCVHVDLGRIGEVKMGVTLLK
jgi:hypothetical protein